MNFKKNVTEKHHELREKKRKGIYPLTLNIS